METSTAPSSARENQGIVAASARDMIDRPPEEAGSVLSTVKSDLSLYRDPVVRENTADSHLQIRDLMHYEDPVSLYIVTRPGDKARLRPLIRILLNMIVRLLAERIEFEHGMPKPAYRHRLGTNRPSTARSVPGHCRAVSLWATRAKPQAAVMFARRVARADGIDLDS